MDLDRIFRYTFLSNAPLYVASSKVKLPAEDLKNTLLYRGALTEHTRPVHKIADYKVFQSRVDAFNTEDEMEKLAREAAHVVDGLIRLENVEHISGQDPRDTQNMKVTDIFEHADGRRNLSVGFVKSVPSIGDPNAMIPGWIFYKFLFACASIIPEYKAK